MPTPSDLHETEGIVVAWEFLIIDVQNVIVRIQQRAIDRVREVEDAIDEINGCLGEAARREVFGDDH